MKAASQTFREILRCFWDPMLRCASSFFPEPMLRWKSGPVSGENRSRVKLISGVAVKIWTPNMGGHAPVDLATGLQITLTTSTAACGRAPHLRRERRGCLCSGWRQGLASDLSRGKLEGASEHLPDEGRYTGQAVGPSEDAPDSGGTNSTGPSHHGLQRCKPVSACVLPKASLEGQCPGLLSRRRD